MATYKAYAAPSAGAPLELVELPVPELAPDHVEIDVLVCGICHSDLSLIDGDWGPFSQYPQVSGHEVVGTVVKCGSAVTDVKEGMRVGVGWQRASCMSCNFCKTDEGECCVGPTGCMPTCAGGNKGGFAEKLFVQSKYAIPVPDTVAPEFIGPLMCGGITAWKPLTTYAKTGDTVGIVGLGGIGAMAVKFAKAMGLSVIGFSTSAKKEADAKALGVGKFVVSTDEEQMKAVESSCDMILYTPNVLPDINPFIAALKMKGKMAFIGAITTPVPVGMFGPPIMKDIIFAGSHIGGPKKLKQMVDFVVSKNIKMPVEVHDFKDIDVCLKKMRNNQQQGRMVLKWNKTPASPAFAFGGGGGPGAGLDCCTMNPNNYKVVAECAGGRLIEMNLAAGEADIAHDHPVHYLYVIKGGKLKLTPPPGHTEGEAEVEMPDGAAMVIPAGPHQVTNVGTTDVKILFVEPTMACVPCQLDDFVSPFDVYPQCYKTLAEDDKWFIGKMTMEAGDQDPPHSHHDHLVYILEGNGITIFPGKEIGDEKMEVPVKPGMALPVPAGHHIVKNTGTEKLDIVFFEQKF